MKTKYLLALALLLLVAVVAAQCGSAAPAPEQVVQTVVVKETVEIMVESTPQIVEKEVVVTATPEPAGEPVTLTVWDWKSGDPVAAPYFEKAKEAFEQLHPNVTINYVMQPHTEYYNIVGAAISANEGPDVLMFHGGANTLDRTAALTPLNDKLGGLKDELVGWSAFTDSEDQIFAIPLTVQGIMVYYNKALYTQAGLDPEKPPTTWEELMTACATIKEKTDKACFAMGDKEGYAMEFWTSIFLSGMLNAEEHQQWISGEMKWTDPKPSRMLEMWVEANEAGWFQEGAVSTPMFMDSFQIFERGDTAHVMGLISDVAHWKEFGDYLGDKNVGILKGVITDPKSVPDVDALKMPADGGIGYAIPKWTKNADLAIEFAKFMANKENLENFFIYAGAMVPRKDFNPALMSSTSGKQVIEWLGCCSFSTPHNWVPTLVMDELHRQSQLLLTGDATPADSAKTLQKTADDNKKS